MFKINNLRLISSQVSFLRNCSSSTTNPHEKILEKVLQERKDDLPISMTSPYTRPVRKCILCEQKVTPNYKNVKLLYQFVSPYTGLIYERHVTGLCKDMQERVVTEIAKARGIGLMAHYLKEPEFLKDPKICDPERPFRSHKY